MRYLLIILLLINTAYAQGTSCFGVCVARPQDTSFTNGQVRYKAYTSGDTTICVLLTNGTMKTIPITRLAGTTYTAGYGLGLTGFQFYVDTNVVPSQYQVDTMRDNIYAVIGGLPTPSWSQTTTVDSVTMNEITIGTLPATIPTVGYDGLRVGTSTNSLNSTGFSARAIAGASHFTRIAADTSTVVLVGGAFQVSTDPTSTAGVDDHDFDRPEEKAAGADMVSVDGRVDIRGSGWVSSSAVFSAQLGMASPANMRSYASFLSVGYKRNTGTTLTNFYSDYIQERPSLLGAGTLTNRYGIYMDSLVAGTNNYGIYFANTPNMGTFYSPLDITVAAQALRISSGKFHLATTILGATSDSTLVKSGTEVKAVAPLATILADYAPVSGSANYIQNGTSLQASSNYNISGNGTIGGKLITDSVQNTTTNTTPLVLNNSVGIVGAPLNNNASLSINPDGVSSITGMAGAVARTTTIEVLSPANGQHFHRFISASSTASHGVTQRYFRNKNASYSSNTALASGDRIASFQFIGTDGTTWDANVSSQVFFNAAENFAVGAHGGEIDFQVVPLLSGTLSSVMKLRDNKVLIRQNDDGSGRELQVTGQVGVTDTIRTNTVMQEAGITSAILKTNANGVHAAAVASTDYVPPTTAVNGQQLTGSIVISSDDVPNDDALTGAGTYNIPATAGTIYISFTGTTATWTLPTLASSEHASYFIKNRGSGDITLNSNAGGNDIYNTSAVNTFTIAAGLAYLIHNDGTFFNIE